MATCVTPAARISASVACRTSGVGVVKAAWYVVVPKRYVTVPMTPGVPPAARASPSTRNVVVVLPLVPVTAIIVIASAGRPQRLAAIVASARVDDATRTRTPGNPCAAPSSTTAATAPRSAAAPR